MATVSFTEQRAVVGFDGVNTGTGLNAVATPSWRPNSIALTVNPSVETEEVRMAGSYFPSVVYETGEGSTGGGDGVPDFRDLTHILTSAFGTPTKTTIGAAVPGATPPELAAIQRTYTMKSARPLWHVYYGNGTLWSVAHNVYATGLSFEFGKQSRTSSVTLDLEGGQYEDMPASGTGYTLANATPAALTGVVPFDPVPIVPLYWDVFASTDPAIYAMSDTALMGSAHKLNRVLSVSINFSDLAGGVAFADSTTTSVSDVVASPVDGTLEIAMEADAKGREYLAGIRTGQTLHFVNRLFGRTFNNATGTATRFTLRFHTPVQWSEVGDRSEEDNVYTANYTARIMEVGSYVPTVVLVNDIP